MKRKMISTVLAGLMAAGLLAGCGSTASSSTAAKSNSVETGSTAVASASGQSGSGKYAGETITIKNYTKIKNTATGLTYLTIFQGNKLQVTVGAHDSKIEIPIIMIKL